MENILVMKYKQMFVYYTDVLWRIRTFVCYSVDCKTEPDLNYTNK